MVTVTQSNANRPFAANHPNLLSGIRRCPERISLHRGGIKYLRFDVLPRITDRYVILRQMVVQLAGRRCSLPVVLWVTFGSIPLSYPGRIFQLNVSIVIALLQQYPVTRLLLRNQWRLFSNAYTACNACGQSVVLPASLMDFNVVLRRKHRHPSEPAPRHPAYRQHHDEVVLPRSCLAHHPGTFGKSKNVGRLTICRCIGSSSEELINSAPVALAVTVPGRSDSLYSLHHCHTC